MLPRLLQVDSTEIIILFFIKFVGSNQFFFLSLWLSKSVSVIVHRTDAVLEKKSEVHWFLFYLSSLSLKCKGFVRERTNMSRRQVVGLQDLVSCLPLKKELWGPTEGRRCKSLYLLPSLRSPLALSHSTPSTSQYVRGFTKSLAEGCSYWMSSL